MLDQIIAFVLNESKWMPIAMSLAFLAVGAVAWAQRGTDLARRGRISSAMNLFYGCMIGVMGCGHLLAVTIKILQGTLEGSAWLLVPLGIALVVPAGWLVLLAPAIARDDPAAGKKAVALNGWLGVFLTALGPHNLPLVAPAVLNVGYHYHSRRAVGWTLATLTTAGYLALFVGSMMFFASGQSFEEFKGLDSPPSAYP